MPIIRDRDGNVYSISFKDLAPYKVTESDAANVELEGDMDVELQSASGPGSRPQPTPHQWYAGD